MRPQIVILGVILVPLGVEHIEEGVHVIQGVPWLELANPLAYLVVGRGLVGGR